MIRLTFQMADYASGSNPPYGLNRLRKSLFFRHDAVKILFVHADGAKELDLDGQITRLNRTRAGVQQDG